jgi:O-antigen/teichoic acid export membrane protein
VTQAAASHAQDVATGSTGRSLALVYLGFGLRSLYLVVLLPFYSRVLGSSGYGRLLAAMSLSQVVWILVEYGFAAYGLREVASARTSQELGAAYARHVRARCLFLVPAALVGALGTLLSPPLREAPIFGALATLNGALSAFNLGWYFQGLGRFATSVAIEAAGFAINLPLILAFVRGPEDGWRALVVLSLSALLCNVAAHVLACRSYTPGRSTWREAWGLTRAAGALFAQRSLTLLVSSSSTYVVSAYGSAAAAGMYGSAERIAAVGLSLLQPASQVVTSNVSGRLGRGHSPTALRRYVRTAVLALTSFGFALWLGTLVLAEPVVQLMLGPEFLPAVTILCQLGWIFPFAAFTQAAAGYVLIPLHRDTTVLRVMLLGAAVALTGQLLLAPTHGGAGVAFARVAGSVLTSLALAWQLWSCDLWRAQGRTHDMEEPRGEKLRECTLHD